MQYLFSYLMHLCLLWNIKRKIFSCTFCLFLCIAVSLLCFVKQRKFLVKKELPTWNTTNTCVYYKQADDINMDCWIYSRCLLGRSFSICSHYRQELKHKLKWSLHVHVNSSESHSCTCPALENNNKSTTIWKLWAPSHILMSIAACEFLTSLAYFQMCIIMQFLQTHFICIYMYFGLLISERYRRFVCDVLHFTAIQGHLKPCWSCTKYMTD